MKKLTLGITAVVFLLSPVSFCRARSADRIKPYRENPKYWQYKSEPVLLLGGSKTDHIFLAEGLKEHLDEMVGVGANYVRNTMSQREGLDLKPHRRLADGKFDLDQWNPVYWRKFADCLKWCEERDIIIQIEVWDRFDYAQDNWLHSPWRPHNNVNYTSAESGLANNYPAPAYRDRQPFFHAIPGMKGYNTKLDLVRRYQEEFVTRMLSYSLQYPNVLYCMNNETSTAPQWGRYWMKFIRDRAGEEGIEIFLTDMFDDGWKPQSSAKIRQAFDSPEIYPFIDISQVNSRAFQEDHWRNLLWLIQQRKAYPRPLNHTKIYSDGQTRWGSGTPKDGIERFWRNLIAGSASCRFHRPTGGIGLNDVSKACIRAGRKVEQNVRFWDVEPRMGLLSDRETDEAYLSALPGEKYVLYFTEGGSVGLDLTGHRGRFQLRWISIRTGDWADKTVVSGDKVVTINAPSKAPWVATVVRQ
jgi:hypothetical protein